MLMNGDVVKPIKGIAKCVWTGHKEPQLFIQHFESQKSDDRVIQLHRRQLTFWTALAAIFECFNDRQSAYRIKL